MHVLINQCKLLKVAHSSRPTVPPTASSWRLPYLWTDSRLVSRSPEWRKRISCSVIKAFAKIDLSLDRVDNHQMGYVFEELIRIGAEQSNEEAGEHFTLAKGSG